MQAEIETQSSGESESETMLNPELISWQNDVFRCYVGWSVVLVLKMFAMSILTGLWRFIRLVSLYWFRVVSVTCRFATQTHTELSPTHSYQRVYILYIACSQAICGENVRYLLLWSPRSPSYQRERERTKRAGI